MAQNKEYVDKSIADYVRKGIRDAIVEGVILVGTDHLKVIIEELIKEYDQGEVGVVKADVLLKEVEEACKQLCERCKEGLPRFKGEDDMGVEWWHKPSEDTMAHCSASDYLEGRSKP